MQGSSSTALHIRQQAAGGRRQAAGGRQLSPCLPLLTWLLLLWLLWLLLRLLRLAVRHQHLNISCNTGNICHKKQELGYFW